MLDHLPFNYLRAEGNRVALENPGPQEWVHFLDQTRISCSILYPAFGRFVAEHWAIAARRAYDTWLYEKLTSKSSRNSAAADPGRRSGIAELHRAVKSAIK